MRNLMHRVSLAAATLLVLSGAAGARTPEQFYKGRQLTMIVYSAAGSAYDVYARALTRHMGKHIPGNPTNTWLAPAGSRRSRHSGGSHRRTAA